MDHLFRSATLRETALRERKSEFKLQARQSAGHRYRRKVVGCFRSSHSKRLYPAQSLREITEIRDGAAWVPAGLTGPHEVLFFISSRTGMQVKRPAIGSEGYVLNHLDRTATDNYLKNVGDRLMQAFSTNGSNRPYAIFCDSLEVYGQDWTPDLLDEFKKRRGYDLKPYLPALVMDIGPDTTKIRRDWGLTLTELLNERFLAPVAFMVQAVIELCFAFRTTEYRRRPSRAMPTTI